LQIKWDYKKMFIGAKIPSQKAADALDVMCLRRILQF
jgi:hypothetical protein